MDEKFMYEAIKEGQKAYELGEVPIGAVIVYDNQIIARGYNKKEMTNNPTSHGEMEAIIEASEKLGRWRLSGCTLYVTLEPCSMCAGAIINARIDRLVIGTMDEKRGCCGSKINILNHSISNHKMDIKYDVLKDECSFLLSSFFTEIRQKKIDNK